MRRAELQRVQRVPRLPRLPRAERVRSAVCRAWPADASHGCPTSQWLPYLPWGWLPHLLPPALLGHASSFPPVAQHQARCVV